MAAECPEIFIPAGISLTMSKVPMTKGNISMVMEIAGFSPETLSLTIF
jgi:hypothetical protein